MTKSYDLLVLGFGKAGKTLAKVFATKGYTVAMVEEDSNMYGGTCINVGCIPSKTLLHEGLETNDFTKAMARKKDVVSALNKKNFMNLDSEDKIDIYTYRGEFKDNHHINLLDNNNNVVETLKGERIIINTGAKSNIPNIPGVYDVKGIYDSRGIMNLTEKPERLAIVGASYIALEFATIFASLGSKVTVLNVHKHIIPREDKDIATEVYNNLVAQGVEFIDEIEINGFKSEDNKPVIETSKGDVNADAILLATGRKPNTDITLENTGVQLGEHGEIKVNKFLQTDVEHIYAVGDVKGGMQFTYISLDDFRIVRDHILGNKQRTTENRGEVPYTVFIDPPLSRIGLTASQAKKEGYNIKENAMPVNTIPRHKVNNDDRGLFKVVVNADNDQILGASLYGKESEEIINLIKLAMDQNLPYTILRDQIYTHPTMAESFNDLFNV